MSLGAGTGDFDAETEVAATDHQTDSSRQRDQYGGKPQKTIHRHRDLLVCRPSNPL
jgi:hypothetical protein